MIDPGEALFQTPPLLRGLCYLSGMSLFISTVFWLSLLAAGRPSIYTLRQISGIWLLRILAASAAISLALMVLSINPVSRPSRALPEMAILLLLGALFVISLRRENLPLQEIFLRRLPVELSRTAGVALLSILAWGFSLGLGWVFFHLAGALHLPVWTPAFIIGLLWNAPLLLLYSLIRKHGRAEHLKFHQLLWPVLLAYLMILLPDFINSLGASPKIEEMMQGRPHLRII